MSSQDAERKDLLEAEERFRILAGLTSDFVYLVHVAADGQRFRNLWLSESFEKVFGRKHQELRRMHWRQFVHPDDQYLIVERISVLLAGRPFRGEARVFDHEGNIRWLADHAKPLIDPETGRVTKVLGVLKDVTDRKVAEQRRLESEEQYRQLVDASPLAIMVHAGHRIAFLNQEAVRLLGGRSADDFIGMPLEQGLHPDDLESTDRRVEEVYRRRHTAIGAEVRFRRLDGGFLDVELVTKPITYHGKAAAQVLFYDITEKKEAERRRYDLEARTLAAQKLESLGSLAAGIAHDFNNILVGILGHTDLAFEHLPPGDPAGEHLEEIGRAAQHAADLAQQLLDYSGSARFKSKELDLSGLVAEMSRLLEVSVKKKAAIAFSLASGLPRFEADPTQLRQVLMNLVINAADAVAEGSGRIVVRTGQVEDLGGGVHGETFLTDGGPGVFLEVEDNGCGMDEETRKHLFEPFYTTKVTGRGLGMATVLGIVRGHHGAIDVDTRLGQGSRLRILFPVRVARPALAGAAMG